VAIIYLETNYLVGTATGRLPPFEKFFEQTRPAQLAIPTVCFMEALTALRGEQRASAISQKWLQDRVNKVKASKLIANAGQLRQNLEDAYISEGRRINTIQTQLNDVINQVAKNARMVELTTVAIQGAIAMPYCNQLTDNLILHIILADAQSEHDPARALFTENIRDFRDGGGDELRRAGVTGFGDWDSLARWVKRGTR
jgi:hypothetical protein